MANPDAYALVAIDPGGTSGIATGLIDMRQQTVASAMRRAWIKGHLRTFEITGGYVEQCLEIKRRMNDFWFRAHIEKGYVRANHHKVAIESFQLRQMSADLTPISIIAGLKVMLAAGDGIESIDEYLVEQTPSEGKGFCTDQMLKQWGFWRGRTDHERDALRHLARLIDRMIDE